MKRILTTMCALTLLLAASVPALAVEPEQSASYYPTSVEEYMEGDSPRIKKVYQLSLADDPSQIPTEDFERDGRLYYLLDMTRKDEVGVDIQTITQTKTLASETNNMEKILQSLEPQMEVTTEDGYTGTLTLDHTTVKVAAPHTISGFVYTPNQGRDSQGHISNYQLSVDGKVVASGEFSNIKHNPIEQEIRFAPVKGRKLVFKATRIVDNVKRVGIAEFSVITED